MHYEDRLRGSEFGRVVLAGGGSPAALDGQDAVYLRRALEQRLVTRVDAVGPRNAATLRDRITANSELLDVLALLASLLARERSACDAAYQHFYSSFLYRSRPSRRARRHRGVCLHSDDLQPDADRPVDPPPIVAQQPGVGRRGARDRASGACGPNATG